MSKISDIKRNSKKKRIDYEINDDNSIKGLLNLKDKTSKRSKLSSFILISAIIFSGVFSIIMVQQISNNTSVLIDRDVQAADCSMEATINLIASRDAMAEYATILDSSERESIEEEYYEFVTVVEEEISGFGELSLTPDMETLIENASAKFVEYNASCTIYRQFFEYEQANITVQEEEMVDVDSTAGEIKFIICELAQDATVLSNDTLTYALVNMSIFFVEMMDFGAETLAFNEPALVDEYQAAKMGYLSACVYFEQNGAFTTELNTLSTKETIFFESSESMIDARVDELYAMIARLTEMEVLDGISGEMEEILEELEIIAVGRMEVTRSLGQILTMTTIIVTCIIIGTIFFVAIKNYKYIDKSLDTLADKFSTSAKSLEKAMGYSENLVSGLPLGIMAVDGDFMVEKINPGFTRITGWNEEDIIGNKCYNLLKTEKCQTNECPIRKAMMNRNITEPFDIDFTDSSGNKRLFRIIGSPILGKSGLVSGGIESIQDVTLERTISREIEKVSIQVRQSSNETQLSVEQINSASQEISITAQQVSSGSQTQSERLQGVVGVINDMMESSNETVKGAGNLVEIAEKTNNIAAQGEEQTRNAVKTIDNIMESSQASLKSIESLGQKSKQIGQIVDIITGIAEQTNLLALNASIEAARAGEYGRGFAVVADEVKNLAEDSKKAGAQIAELIYKIQDEVEASVENAKLGNALSKKGKEVVIGAANALKQIIDAVKETNEGINEINVSMAGQNENINTVMMDINEVSSISEEASASAEELSSSAEELSAAMEELNAGAQELASMTEKLTKTVEKT
ncbi:MAG: methyl-accepting chemotaxis protein [Promethearchaeota archaeon]